MRMRTRTRTRAKRGMRMKIAGNLTAKNSSVSFIANEGCSAMGCVSCKGAAELGTIINID